ncbi:MAG: hypothetical protein HY367_01955, partial [Candidatus Aenigmarchaeota archaeon]|nr:hypothetical protein [Candidatus Aenigmarchaeota archaeon]
MEEGGGNRKLDYGEMFRDNTVASFYANLHAGNTRDAFQDAHSLLEKDVLAALSASIYGDMKDITTQAVARACSMDSIGTYFNASKKGDEQGIEDARTALSMFEGGELVYKLGIVFGDENLKERGAGKISATRVL